LDVGQGDAIFVTTPSGEQILVDGGPSDQVLVELGNHMPFWDRSLDLVILSHPHADHLTGLIEVARRYRIGALWLSGAVHTTPEFLSWLETIRDRDIPVETVLAGTEKTLGEVQLEVLYPPTDQTGIRPANQHEATVVVRLEHGAQTVLLTGDLESGEEKTLVETYCPDLHRPCPKLQADFLKVPHHGSKSGLEPDFLAAVAPKAAAISSGFKNPYGHPHVSILERLKSLNILTYRTDLNGTIELRADGSVVSEHPR
jgi:competence protein ComEC